MIENFAAAADREDSAQLPMGSGFFRVRGLLETFERKFCGVDHGLQLNDAKKTTLEARGVKCLERRIRQYDGGVQRKFFTEILDVRGAAVADEYELSPGFLVLLAARPNLLSVGPASDARKVS